jgi:uncharacterized membrane protein YqjE
MADKLPQQNLDDSSIGGLIKQLSAQTSELVRKEAELARAEMAEKGKLVGAGAGMFGGAAVFALYAVGALTAAAILGLAIVLDAWLAALAVGAAYLALAALLALIGKLRVQRGVPPTPEQAVQAARESVQEVRERLTARRG